MTESVRIVVNGTPQSAPAGATLAAALLNAGYSAFRHSVRGEPRGPVCGMGMCQECRVAIDGVPGRRACLELVREGMVVTIDD